MKVGFGVESGGLGMFPPVTDRGCVAITRAEITVSALQPTSKRARSKKSRLALCRPPRSPRSWQRVDRNFTNTLYVPILLSL
jgi:hypothetical protein